MAITSEEIHNQSFSIERKGYDVDEVDVFLEHVAAEIDELNAIINDLNAQLDAVDARFADDQAAEEADAFDMDAAFAEPPLPEQEPEVAPVMDETEKDARIAELEAMLAEKTSDASAIADALVTAQRSAQDVVKKANDEAKRIHADAEADAADIIDRAEAEKAKIEQAIVDLEASHKETCEAYSEVLKNFIEDATSKLDDVEDELSKRDGKKRAHARFASPTQAPIHKPATFDSTGAVVPSYTAPAATAAVPVTVASEPKVSSVEKDLSGYGDASDAFDLGDID